METIKEGKEDSLACVANIARANLVSPETLRNFSQTTTTTTIVKHMAHKCLSIPLKRANAIKELKILEVKAKGKKSMSHQSSQKRKRQINRKAFFEAVWKRLQKIDSVPTNSFDTDDDRSDLKREEKKRDFSKVETNDANKFLSNS